MQKVPRILGAFERPLVFGTPAPTVIETPLGVLAAIATTHDEDAHGRLAFDANVDALQPPVEPAFLLRVEPDKTPDGVRAEVHTVSPGQGVARAHVCPGA